MALNGLYSAVSGMRVAGAGVNQSSHNLANANTTGYVPRRVDVADTAGGGAHVAGTTPMGSGPIITTGNPVDMAINGGGFFALNDGQGGRLYTRAGNFTVDEQGRLVDQQGRALEPPVNIPADSAQVNITEGGLVQALDQGGNVLAQSQIETAVFGNPGGLKAMGGNAFAETQASGPPVTAAPGEAGHGEIVSGALQGSGTSAGMEMIALIMNQRMHQANVRSAQIQDEALGSIIDVVG